MLQIPSKLISDAVAEFSRLPGVGEKTALRLVLHLLKQDEDRVTQFGSVITRMRQEIRYCTCCGNVADDALCGICASPSRNHGLVCVVETLRDVIAIENTGIYKGVYHVLSGVISPMDGIGPDQLNIQSLVSRIEAGGVEEVILALSPTMDGDTTIFYLSKKLQPLPVKLTTIARGVAFGGELEYTDELTLARSIVTRLPYEQMAAKQNGL